MWAGCMEPTGICQGRITAAQAGDGWLHGPYQHRRSLFLHHELAIRTLVQHFCLPTCSSQPPPLPRLALPNPGSEPVDRATFMRNLWWCFNTLEEKATDDSGKPAYFRFLTLLSERAPGCPCTQLACCRPPPACCCWAGTDRHVCGATSMPLALHWHCLDSGAHAPPPAPS